MVPAGRGDGHDDDTTAARQPPSAVCELFATWDGGAATLKLPSRGVVVIGRATTSDLCIPHASVSRRHAALHAGAGLEIEDLESANGTRVDGEVVGSRMPLETGSVIEVGEARVIARIVPERDATSPMERVQRIVERVARSDISVVLVGETGAGKEVLAEEIHRRSLRARGPLLKLNCAALPPNLLESELFGYEKGAFTGAGQAKVGLLEAANGGSVLLDEVGELPPEVQPKLLRALENREVLRVGARRPLPVDVRFIAATLRDLEALVVLGKFRHDLLFRLKGITIHVPPLRARAADIPALVEVLLRDACARSGRPLLPMTEDALELLRSYRWPGNVRELKNVLERAVLLCDDVHVAARHLTFDRSAIPPEPARPPGDEPSGERDRIQRALDRCAGNQTEAAKLLGISRRMLAYRLDKLGVRRPRKGKGDFG